MQELTTANERRLFQELQSTKNLVQEQVGFIPHKSCPAAFDLWPKPLQHICLMCDTHGRRNSSLTAKCTGLYICLQLAQNALVAYGF